MARMMILYSTVDGHALTISRFIGKRLSAMGHTVRCLSVTEAADRFDDCQKWHPDKILIGASIRYGKHRPEVYTFIKAHEDWLSEQFSALFSVSLVARKPNKNTPETNPYLRKFLSQISWKPDLVASFAGRLDYPSYGFIDRQMIRLIMWLTGGETNADAIIEYTDWERVSDFTHNLAKG